MPESDPPNASSPTRRTLMGGATLAVAAAAAGAHAAPATPMAVKPSGAETRTRTALHQEVNFDASPAKVYAALMSSKAFADFTGMPAKIDPGLGGAISMFGGLIVGRNIELAPGKRIVQAWRAVQDFPSGVYSLVKMDLSPAGAGTRLVLDHTGFPEGHYDHLYEGWPPRYWIPLKKYLASTHSG
jgi:activator of HSP90 ATPase